MVYILCKRNESEYLKVEFRLVKLILEHILTRCMETAVKCVLKFPTPLIIFCCYVIDDFNDG